MMELIQKRRLDPSTALTVIKERKDAVIKFSNIKKILKIILLKHHLF